MDRPTGTEKTLKKANPTRHLRERMFAKLTFLVVLISFWLLFLIRPGWWLLLKLLFYYEWRWWSHISLNFKSSLGVNKRQAAEKEEMVLWRVSLQCYTRMLTATDLLEPWAEWWWSKAEELLEEIQRMLTPKACLGFLILLWPEWKV